nr:hypothetical protein BaRGS_015661 [Batillaria attramentaria]
MVDYIWETEVLVMFLVGEQCIGRAAFKRKTPDTPVYATVAVQGQGVKVTVDWTRVLFPAMFHDEKNPALKKWLSGEEVTLEGNGKTVIHGKATSIQAPYCFKEKFLEIDSPPQVKNVTSLGVGILFTQQDFRQPQSVIVYFTSNSYPFHKTVFTSRPGGVFPTVTFPTNGGKFSVKTNTYPMVPDTMRSAWLDNVKTAATPADSSSEGTFSLLTKRTFSKDKTNMSSSQQNRSQDEEVETGVTETTYDGSSKKEVIATATGYKYKASIPIKMASGKVELTEDENGDVVIKKDGETVTKLKDKTPQPRHSTNITLIRSQYCDHNSYKSGREDGTCCNKRQGRGI